MTFHASCTANRIVSNVLKSIMSSLGVFDCASQLCCETMSLGLSLLLYSLYLHLLAFDESDATGSAH